MRLGSSPRDRVARFYGCRREQGGAYSRCVTGLRLSRSCLALLALGAVAISAPPVASAGFPGRNGRIAYEHSRDTNTLGSLGPSNEESEISSVLPDGRRPRTLLGFDRGFIKAPAYSPNGRKLALASPQALDHPVWSLFLVRADGRGPLRALTRPGPGASDLYPSWAPDGRRLVFVRAGQYVRNPTYDAQLRVYRAERSRRVGPFRQGIDHPVWSVRGQIAFSSQMAIYTIRPDGSHGRFVTDGLHPDWSPRGRWIAFTPSPGRGIAIIRPDGRHLRVLTTNEAWDPAFSPDGRYIVFARYDYASYRWTLVKLRLRDRRTRTIVTVPGEEHVGSEVIGQSLGWPTWQPLQRRRHR